MSALLQNTKLKSVKIYSHFGIRCLGAAIIGKITKQPLTLQLKKPGLKHPFFIRVPSSDTRAFKQIFTGLEYEVDFKTNPETIIDAGANVGFASIYFSTKFPNSKIIAIEPEQNNFEILKKNVAPYRNVIPVFGAIWHENTSLGVIDMGGGDWSFMTCEADSFESPRKIVNEVPAMTIDRIMDEHGMTHIDILKIDIEGAEREVFKDSSPWINKVNTVMIELHEWLKPGCLRSFYNGSNGFDNEWRKGETVFLSRNDICAAY